MVIINRNRATRDKRSKMDVNRMCFVAIFVDKKLKRVVLKGIKGVITWERGQNDFLKTVIINRKWADEIRYREWTER